MRQVLVRFSRRLAVWEPGRTVEEIQQSEFRRKDGAADLRPSVYEIEEAGLVRAFAEHATVFNPPSSNAGIDLAGLGHRPNPTPGRTGFTFTTAAHRELRLKSEGDLLDLIRKAVASLGSRAHKVSRAEIVAYAKARLAEGDEEWQSAATRARQGSWVSKLAVERHEAG